MIVYLGHAKANYSSEIDGYILAAKEIDHTQMLCSFVYTDGKTIPGIKNESLLCSVGPARVDVERLGTVPASG